MVKNINQFYPRWENINLFHPLEKKENRGQMKIQQMAFMLVAVMLLFGLIAIFVAFFAISGIKEDASLLEEKNALLLVTKLTNSPEFSCGQVFGGEKTNCIDLDKVMMLKQKISDYSSFWGVSNIEIMKIYPKENLEVECTLDNYPNCGIIKILSESNQGTGIANFAALCRKDLIDGRTQNKCELGKIIVSYETK